jgi:hypothetical protein
LDQEKEDCEEMDVTEEDSSCEELEKRLLKVNSVVELQAIAAKEKVVVPKGRKNKDDYVNAIYLARHPPSGT